MTERIAWAQRVFSNPDNVAKGVLLYVLGANNTATVAAIKGASDALLQTNVDAAVDALAKGLTPGA